MAELRIPITQEIEQDIRELVLASVREAIDEAKSRPAEKDYLTSKETQDYLGISYNTLQKWREQGLKAFRLEGVTLYSRRSIQEFLQAREQ